MSQAPVHNRVINHVALSVTDLDATVDWYTKVFGFQLLGKPIHIKRSESPNDAIFGIYPSNLNEVKLAYMTTGNGVGWELFEFLDPKPEPQASFEYHKTGFFHACVTDPDPDALAALVVAEGGKKIGTTVDPSTVGAVKCLYVADPWGNVVEILNVSFEWLGCRTAFVAQR